MTTIWEFQGPHRFLSNFWPARVMFEGILFPSAEHAYQAAKFQDLEVRHHIATLENAGQAKRAGKQAVLDGTWDARRFGVMDRIVRQKFMANAHLGRMLLATGDARLEEGNWWGDRYWGVSPARSGRGLNKLGEILMKVREELQ